MRDAVRLVLDGGKYLPPEALSAPGDVETVDHPRPEATSVQSLGLTQRQIDVLRLMASGASNKIICRELGLADRTVKAHITGVFRVLNVSSRTQAVLAASRIGLIGKAQGDGRSAGP